MENGINIHRNDAGILFVAGIIVFQDKMTNADIVLPHTVDMLVNRNGL